MKKPIIVAAVILSALVMVSTGCTKRKEAVDLPIETTATSSSAADTVSVDEDESTTSPPTDTKPATEEIISDAPEETSDVEVEAENPYVSTYRNRVGDSVKVLMINDELVQFRSFYGNGDGSASFAIDKNWEDDSILAYKSPDEPENDYGTEYAFLRIYPVGTEFLAYDNTNGSQVATDDSRIRLYLGTYDARLDHDVFYKVEPLKEGELSYLPTPGFLHEFMYDNLEREYKFTVLSQYIEDESGNIKAHTVATFVNGEEEEIPASYRNDTPYFEDSSGFYRYGIMMIKYPIVVGEVFGDSTVMAAGEKITTPAGEFEDVVVINGPGSTNRGATLYYAPGVGRIKEDSMISIGELVKISK